MTNLNKKIFKSCTSEMTHDQFERAFKTGYMMTFISYERLLKETIGENLKSNEDIVGMVMDIDGITFYLKSK